MSPESCGYELNPQSIFNYAYKFIVEQGQPSVTINKFTSCVSGCRYLGDSGLKCAASCLFTDEERQYVLDEGMNSGSVHNLRSRSLFPERLYPFFQIINSIQSAHDDAALRKQGEEWSTNGDFVAAFKVNMARVAEDYKLELP